MKHYYATFKATPQVIEVEFPDLPGCLTFGKDWDEAIENATDALAGWLAHADKKFIKSPSTHKELEKFSDALVPIAVEDKIIKSYQELKRFNVIFPANILQQVDRFRKAKGIKRSTFLLKAAEEYLQNHSG